MKLKYFIVKGKNKYCNIYVRFWDGKRIDQKTKTGISTLPIDWSEKKQRIKIKVTETNFDLLNNKLDELEKHIYNKYNLDYNSKEYITKSWLKDNVNNFFSRVPENENYKIYFVDWVERFVATAHKRIFKGKPIKERTLKNYTSTLNKLREFEAIQNKKYRFEDIDLNFHRDFIFFCYETVKLNNNSTGSLISRIKTFCRNIELDGFPINPKYKHSEFNTPKEETFDIYLSEEEINLIFNFDFSNNERLENTRDLFIIGLRTGLRVSDFIRIKDENIFENVINITTEKTNQNLTIPIHPQFKEILSKRNNKFPREISHSKFNKYIKEVCKNVAINEKIYGSKVDELTKRKVPGYYQKWEFVSSHICRRSFATNLFLAGIEVAIIRKATGHSSEKLFLNYVKASKNEHIQKLNDYWTKK